MTGSAASLEGLGAAAGRRPPLSVLVPGLGLDGRAWASVQAALGDGVRVVGLPSLGEPAPRGTDLRVEAQAERLLHALTSAGVSSAVLVGHSASCPVVVEVAARSHLAVGLVLVGPATDPRAATWPRMLLQWARTARRERPWLFPLLLPQYRRTGGQDMVRGMDATRGYRIDHGLARCRVPVVIVRGEHDRIATDAWARHLAEVGCVELTRVSSGAHMLPLTHPQAVAQAVRGIVTLAHQRG